MEEIRKQVSRARRRLVLEQFISVFGWCMFSCLLVAVVALAIPKVWALPVGGAAWTYGWLAGGLACGLLLTAVWTYFIRRGELDAAIELDRRFGLKERVSSTLSLPPADLQSEVGQALVSDAERRIARLDVRDQFRIQRDLRALIPLVPALLLVGLLFLDDAATRRAEASNDADRLARQTVKTATETLRARVAEQKKRLAEDGLKEAEAMLQRLGDGLERMKSDNDTDRRKALIEISDLSKELADRKRALGGTDKLRRQLSQMKNLQSGPADKLADAIKQGDFEKAINAMQKLQDKLEKGQLNDQERQQLAQQMKQMQDKLQQMAEAHEQAKRDLEEQIEQRMKAGDLAGAGRLQQQLDQLKMQDQQMQQMQQMASQLGQAADALQSGNQQQASQQLKQMADTLQQMQQQLDELETIDDIMNEIAGAKNAMNCKQCNGQGCQACQGGTMGMAGMGSGNSRNGRPGMGMGEGQGRGDRPEEETDTSAYDTRVRQQLQKGEVVRTGDAFGANLSGRSREQVKQEILGSRIERADPITNQRLPRSQREHLQEYFKAYTDDGE